MITYELNLDGLVGPTHHYAGLAFGNLASIKNAQTQANPKEAALQGLHKMRIVHQAGVKQAILPPHQRPNLELLHQLGFSGTPTQQIMKAKRTSLDLLSACYSASSMWAANAATVSASLDTDNSKVHFTSANLITHLHRHQEADFSHHLLKHIFSDERYFHHHDVLPRSMSTADEGAANHSRLCEHHSQPGVTLLVYGKNNSDNDLSLSHYPARQTLKASEAICRSHGLNPNHVVFAHQNTKAIDHGVFHNDVIAVANESVLLVHEEAFTNQPMVLKELQSKSQFPIHIIQISANKLSLDDAVKSYLFNSQLLTLPDHSMLLLAPFECEQTPHIHSIIKDIIQSKDNPINQVHYLNLKQSMRNGGGPACLRLRVPLTEMELAHMKQTVLVNNELLDKLEAWVKRHYREQLHANDLDDPTLINESFAALDELSTLLSLGSIYPFQRT